MHREWDEKDSEMRYKERQASSRTHEECIKCCKCSNVIIWCFCYILHCSLEIFQAFKLSLEFLFIGRFYWIFWWNWESWLCHWHLNGKLFGLCMNTKDNIWNYPEIMQKSSLDIKTYLNSTNFQKCEKKVTNFRKCVETTKSAWKFKKKSRNNIQVLISSIVWNNPIKYEKTFVCIHESEWIQSM